MATCTLPETVMILRAENPSSREFSEKNADVLDPLETPLVGPRANELAK